MCCDWIHTSSLSVMPLNHKPTVSSGDLIEFGVHVGLWWIVLCVAQHFEILCGSECSDRSVGCIVIQTDERGSRNCMRVFWHAGSYCMALENCLQIACPTRIDRLLLGAEEMPSSNKEASLWLVRPSTDVGLVASFFG